MIVLATNKLTGSVKIFSGATSYNEIYNPSIRKWFHCIETPTNTILIDSKEYRISVRDSMKGAKK